MAGSISGLASGLDTATIINQLMQLEASSQNRLKTRVTTEQKEVSSLTSFNTKLAALATKFKEAADPLVWSKGTATSSAPGVTVTATAAAGNTSLSATVVQTARTHQLGFATAAGLSDVVVPGGTTVRIDRLDGTTLDVDTGDGTLQGLAAALNDPANATGLRATTVKVADGSYRLLVESAVTGQAQDFGLTAVDGTPLLGGATVRAGRDAQLDLGAGLVATSTTNTFADLMPGVTVTIAPSVADGTATDITIAPDKGSAATRVKEMVDALNAAIDEAGSLTRTSGTAAIRGLLAGDVTVRNVQSQLQSAAYGPEGSLATLGIQVDRNGRYAFDQAKFEAAYAADATGVASTLATGFVSRVQEVAETASDKRDGLITGAITGRENSIKTLNQSIESWDRRLELRRTALTRQFTALETALGQMTSQSNWLAGQIGSLSGSNG